MKKFTKEHEWIELINENEAYVGITDFASHELGDIVFVDIEKGVNSVVDADSSFGIVEAVKTVSDLFMPIGGSIIEVNENIESSPELVNSDPYGEGWMIKIEIKDVSEIENLLSSEDYSNLI